MADSLPELEPLPPRTSERLLIEALRDRPPTFAGRVLGTSLGRGQLAAFLAEAFSGSRVECLYLDLYQAIQGRQAIGNLANCDFFCQPDFSPGEAQLVAIPTQHDGIAELTRDLMQQGFEQLPIGGELWTSVDYADDTWLCGEMERLCDELEAFKSPEGVVYRGVKTKPLKKHKNFDASFPLREGERTLTLFSRPGVFSHRRTDVGAKALLATLAVRRTDRVFEIGCGSGAVTLGCAARAPQGFVYATDSNPRAVQCTQRGAEANELSNVKVVLGADGRCDEPGTYDLAVGNPPYYSHQRIAEVFVQGALDALKPGGSAQFVTKHAAWYEERLAPHFREVFTEPCKGYFVVIGTGKSVG